MRRQAARRVALTFDDLAGSVAARAEARRRAGLGDRQAARLLDAVESGYRALTQQFANTDSPS